MTRHEPRYWLLAAGMAAVAGYVDAIGFLTLGGLFVSFMSGNSTRMAVGLFNAPDVAFVAARLLLGFVAGVIAGSLIGARAGRHRKPVLLATVGATLIVPAAGTAVVPLSIATTAMTMAMGAANTVFERNGEVSIGVTYMTGTLVKFGQHLASALMGGQRWKWVPYLLLWGSLVMGGVAGAFAYPRFGWPGLWVAVALCWLLACGAALLGPADRHALETQG